MDIGIIDIGIIKEQLQTMQTRALDLKRLANYDHAKQLLVELKPKLEDANLWKDPAEARNLGKRCANLEDTISRLDSLAVEIEDCQAMLELVEEAEAEDETMLADLAKEVKTLDERIERMEFTALFTDKNDRSNAFVDIKPGQGGTEAQDWADMLLRMYLRWGEEHNFETELLDYSIGDVAGIKGASIRFIGDYAYGWLRTETGIHRLVRKSPFNAGNKRHTSFASVFVTPEIEDTIEVAINPKDLRVDTYRASGAGGQHVNKTDSAVRLTHVPSGLVVQCQSQRSQHQNRVSAMRQLKSKLYQLEELRRNEAKKTLEANKDEISWGRQIRSYVLDAARIKDLRTGVETSDCDKVLDGNLDPFIEAALRLNAEMANQ